VTTLKPHWYEPAGAKANRLLDSVEQKRDALSRKWTHSISGQLALTCGGPGCTWCCNSLVPTWLSEGLLIARYLLVHDIGVRDLDPLTTAAREASQFMEAHGYGSDAWDGEAASALWYRKRKPCLFLQQGRCGVYEQRPTPCRSMLATSDPALCASADNTVKVVNVTPWMNEGFDNDRWFTHLVFNLPVVWPLALPHAVLQGLLLLTNGMHLNTAQLRCLDAPRAVIGRGPLQNG